MPPDRPPHQGRFVSSCAGCVWAASCAGALSCGSPPAGYGNPGRPDPPRSASAAAPAGEALHVTVSFVDAVLALSHDDGLAWDSPHVVPALTRAALRVARSGPNGYARVTEQIAAHDAEPWGKPDPICAVTLFTSPTCRTEMRLLPVQRDTYRPSWSPGLTWEHVPLERGTRFRVVMEDDDAPRANELIGRSTSPSPRWRPRSRRTAPCIASMSATRVSRSTTSASPSRASERAPEVGYARS